MGRLATFTASHIIALDSNIFISGSDTHNDLYLVCKKLLDTILEVKPTVFLSTLVYMEFATGAYKANREEDIGYIEDFLTQNGTFTMLDFTKEIARGAAQIRAQYPSIKTPDAIHLASALTAKADLFVTTDTHLPKKIGKLEILALTPTP